MKEKQKRIIKLLAGIIIFAGSFFIYHPQISYAQVCGSYDSINSCTGDNNSQSYCCTLCPENSACTTSSGIAGGKACPLGQGSNNPCVNGYSCLPGSCFDQTQTSTVGICVVTGSKCTYGGTNLANGSYCGTNNSVCSSGYCGSDGTCQANPGSGSGNGSTGSCNDLTRSGNTCSGQVCYQGSCTTLSALGVTQSPNGGGSCGSTSSSMITQIQGSIGMTGTDIDGICGANTITAIQVYQQRNGLTPDGVITAGGVTDQKLGYILENGVPPTGGGNGASGSGSSGGGSGSGSGVGGLTCPSGTTLQNGICLPPAQSGGIAGQSTLAGLILQIITILLTFAGLIAIVMIVIGGFQYITAAGNEENAEKGKKALVNAVIGLVVVLLAFAIVRIISNTLTSNNLLTTSYISSRL